MSLDRDLVAAYTSAMRIIHSLEGKSWSGGQQQTLFLVRGQVRRGHQVLLVCHRDGELQRRAEVEGLPVLPHDLRGEFNPASVYRLLKVFDSFKPDVVNVHRAHAHAHWIFVSLIRRFHRLIVTRRVQFKIDSNPVSRSKYRTPAVRGFIAVSQTVSRHLQEIGISSKRIRVIYPATDTDLFDPGKIRGQASCTGPSIPTMGCPAKSFGTHGSKALNASLKTIGMPPKSHERGMPLGAIVMVANYHPNKGHHVLLEAFERLVREVPLASLILAGHGTDGPEMQQQILGKPWAHRVSLLGFRRDVPEILSQSAVAVNASFEEGFSGFVREALSMGVPVIASDISSNREIGDLAPLSFFPCGSSAGLSEVLKKVLQNLPEHEAKSRLREDAVRSFSVDAMVDHTLRAYEELTKGLS